MNVVLMPLNQIIGSCGERNLIALDFNYFWPRSNSGRRRFSVVGRNQRESAGCSQFVSF
jgi:hypothetical protein